MLGMCSLIALDSAQVAYYAPEKALYAYSTLDLGLPGVQGLRSLQKSEYWISHTRQDWICASTMQASLAQNLSSSSMLIGAINA